MHLLFVSGVNILSHSSIDQLLVEQSIKQGKIYDQEGPGVTEHIQSFIDQFQLPLDELVEPDPAKYKVCPRSTWNHKLRLTSLTSSSSDVQLVLLSQDQT
jgi:hypothetical protein